MNDWTVIVCDGGPERAEESAELAARLRRRPDLRVRSCPDPYHLPPDAPALAALRRLEGPLAAVSWHHPRALYWLLRAAGVAGRRADLEEEAGGEGRPIHCFDARRFCCPGKVEEAVAELAAGGAAPGDHERLPGTAGERWYPVLDYNRCTGCMQCLEFCLFGVYAVGPDGRPEAADPDRCKPGCPACSRVCPAGAIMFPLYKGLEAVAGSDRGEIPEFRPEELAGHDLPPDCAREVEKHLGRACGCRPAADPLDRALDRLEEDEGRE